MRPHLGTPDVGLRMELPWRTPVRLAVYDVAGRRLTTLVDRELLAGVTDVKWSGTDDSGSRVASGMYFVRLSCARGATVSKVVMLR
jgi:flagellar hook assembly protein FlgD